MKQHVHPRRRAPRAGRRGLTLIELIVGFLIAIFLTAAAVAFAAQETRLLGISQEKLDLSTSSRAAIDLIAADIAMAGAGVGFLENGNFAGLELGPFNVGGCAFNTTGGAVPFNPAMPPPAGAFTNLNLQAVSNQGVGGAAYQAPSQDLLIRFADGAYATIADFRSAGTGQHCMQAGTRFGANELVILSSQDGLVATSATINSANAAAGCTLNTCVVGCSNFTFVTSNDYQSSPGVSALSGFLGGEVHGGFKQVVWFVVDNPQGEGTLRRHVFDTANPACPGRNNNLGGAVADLVETLNFQVYQFITDPAVVAGAPGWFNAGTVPITNRARTRVDVEVVLRARTATNRPVFPVELRLRANTCIPNLGNCQAAQDYAQRTVVRTSVEVKNAAITL